MKQFLDFLPIIIFFIAYKIDGIYTATLSAIIASFIIVSLVYFLYKKVEKILWINVIVITLMGTATIYFQNALFIKWKPSVINWLLAIIIIFSQLIYKVNICKKLMSNKITLPDNIWHTLNISWSIFFIISGLLNIIVAYQFSENIWVNFKLFGLLGLTIIFLFWQFWFLRSYLTTDKVNG